MKNILLFLVLISTLVVSGCTNNATVPANTSEIINSGQVELQEPVVEETTVVLPDGQYQLEVMSATLNGRNYDVVIKNVGNGTAHDVYVGMVFYDLYPMFTFDQMVTYDYYEWMDNATLEALYARVTSISTGMIVRGPRSSSPAELTITGYLIRESYLGTLEPGETATTSLAYPSDPGANAIVAWTKNDEEHYVYYTY